MIKRYDPESFAEYTYPEIETKPEGDYVKYSDHVEVVKNLLQDLRYLLITQEHMGNPLFWHHFGQYSEKYARMKKEYGL